ncbi:hypothetical protein MJO29_002162, partial [Puccinia striiformis f. sp. tritici]
ARAYALNQGPSSTLAQAALSTHSSSILVVHESSSYDIVKEIQNVFVCLESKGRKADLIIAARAPKMEWSPKLFPWIYGFFDNLSPLVYPKQHLVSNPSPKMFNLREILLVACLDNFAKLISQLLDVILLNGSKIVVGAYAFNKTSIPHESEFPAKANAGAL